MKRTKLICVAGARPNFMKVAPLWRLLGCDRHFACVLVHTGQHYDEQLSGQFFRDLALPEPHHYLGVGSGSHAQQTAEVMRRFEPVLETECADGVIVVGDVNSTMAATVVAAKMHVPVCHVEAGLRSFDRSMPEEINRLITDAISDVLLVSEASGRRNLLSEGIPEYRIHLVGNLMIDSLRQCLGRAQRSGIFSRLRINGRPFGLVTLHRPANVDRAESLDEIAAALIEISQTVPLYFTGHPRTRSHLDRTKIGRSANITLLEPLGYLDFLGLMSHSSVVFTDSGAFRKRLRFWGFLV